MKTATASVIARRHRRVYIIHWVLTVVQQGFRLFAIIEMDVPRGVSNRSTRVVREAGVVVTALLDLSPAACRSAEMPKSLVEDNYVTRVGDDLNGRAVNAVRTGSELHKNVYVFTQLCTTVRL